MGSLPPPPSTSRRPPETPPSSYTVLASFFDPSPTSSAPNWIDGYHPATNSWHRVTSVPGLQPNQILKGFAMATVANSIYIIGGRKCGKAAARNGCGGDEDLEAVGRVWRYNMDEATWGECAALMAPRFDFACSVVGDKIYVAGGQCTIGNVRGSSCAEVYDSVADTWTSMAHMSTSRHKCVGVTWHNRFIVVGGFTDKPVSNTVSNMLDRSSAEVYDPEGDRWQLMVGLWQLDVPPNEIVDVEGELFSSGDCFNRWKGHIETYDAKLNLWYEVDGSQCQLAMSDAGSAGKRLYLTMAPIGAQLYFLTGYSVAEESRRLRSVVHVYDTSASRDGWRTFEATEEEGEKELCGHCCVVKQVL
uniref:Uncharacterized protein n=1 Tax=Kalanchoe fedtschenkoi TaxID=63787 RepID=A0A7N0VB60_KALFE